MLTEIKNKLKEENPFKEIVGQERVKNDVKSALIVGRHIVIVGPPGVGKTTLAKNISRLLPDTTVNYNAQIPKG